MASHAAFNRIEIDLSNTRSIARCCADDLGTILVDVHHLLRLARPFELASKALGLGLHLNCRKCVIVRLAPWPS